MFKTGKVNVSEIRELLDACSLFRSKFHAPEWKTEIDKTVSNRASAMALI